MFLERHADIKADEGDRSQTMGSCPGWPRRAQGASSQTRTWGCSRRETSPWATRVTRLKHRTGQTCPDLLAEALPDIRVQELASELALQKSEPKTHEILNPNPSLKGSKSKATYAATNRVRLGLRWPTTYCTMRPALDPGRAPNATNMG